MRNKVGRISTADAPAAAGHYSQAVVSGDLVFVSGQLGARPDGTHTHGDGFEVQARQALANLLAIVTAAGSDRDRVLRVTVYVVGIGNWPVFDRVFAEIFGPARPARAVVPVPELHYGYLVEVEATATR